MAWLVRQCNAPERFPFSNSPRVFCGTSRQHKISPSPLFQQKLHRQHHQSPIHPFFARCVKIILHRSWNLSKKKFFFDYFKQLPRHKDRKIVTSVTVFADATFGRMTGEKIVSTLAWLHAMITVITFWANCEFQIDQLLRSLQNYFVIRTTTNIGYYYYS